MLLGELGQHLLFTAAQNQAQDVPAIPEFVSGRVVPASAWLCGMSHSAIGHGTGGIVMIVSHGDLVLLVAANDGLVAVHALRALQRSAAAAIWSIDGSGCC